MGLFPRRNSGNSMDTGPDRFDGGLWLALPEDLRRLLLPHLLPLFPNDLSAADAGSIDLILLWRDGRGPADTGRKRAEPPVKSQNAASPLNDSHQVLLERLPCQPGRAKHQRVGQLTIRLSPTSQTVSLLLTVPRFICAKALVHKALEATDEALRLQGVATVTCTMWDFEHALEDFSKAHPSPSFEDVYGTNIRNYLFRLKQALAKRGVASVLRGAFPAGYYLNAHPRNVRYVETR
jgi:hypothetical protein